MEQRLISKKASIDTTAVVGPDTIVEDDVRIGKDTIIGSHVVIRKGTRIGDRNVIHAGAQLGVEPQDYHFKGEVTQCIIGNNNIIREYVTISRATGEHHRTVIGDNNFIMTYVHVAHNITIGNNTIISSGTQLGGHVWLDDYVVIGGLAGVHQFCRIGRYAMLGAKSYLNMDLLPYLLAHGNRAQVYGINVKGLKRHSFSPEEIEKLKDIARNIFRTARTAAEGLEYLRTIQAENRFAGEFLDFFESSRRGILLKTKF